MEKRKSLLFSVGVVHLGAVGSDQCVRSSQAVPVRGHIKCPGNFIVNVAQTTLNGQRTYKYTITNAPGKNETPTSSLFT